VSFSKEFVHFIYWTDLVDLTESVNSNIHWAGWLAKFKPHKCSQLC